jgi:glycosyltransferase involved in cell wall biosynthesis
MSSSLVNEMNKIKLSISAPLYNESKNCVAGIKDMLKQLNKEVKSFELILVNNGSTDDTGKIIEKIKSKHKNIVTVHLKTNQGYGGGIIAGLKKSKGEYVGNTILDGQIDGKDLVRVFNNMIKEKADIGKSVRVKRHDGIKRKIFTIGYESVINILFLTNIRDINGYPKIMKRQIFNKLNIQNKNWFIDTEIMLKAKKRKLKISQTPVIFRKRQGGTSHVNYGTAMELFITAVKTRFKGLKF